MATIIARDDGRFEVRESIATARGPRSRTLAIFRALNDDVLDHADQRAGRALDRKALIARAHALGLHVTRVAGASEPAGFLDRLRNNGLWPTHVRAVQEAIADIEIDALPDHLEAMTDWLGADDRNRADALVDLLRLAGAIVAARDVELRSGPLEFPCLKAVHEQT
jgi:hypothetical protein